MLKSFVRTYAYRVHVEPDGPKYHAYCPVLESYGAATWADTEQDAYKRIQEVVQLVVEELLEDGLSLPTEPPDEVVVFGEPRVAVTV